jgi:hypothetical protein
MKPDKKFAKIVEAGVDPATFPHNRNLIATKLSAEFCIITHTILLVIYKMPGHPCLRH